jgi:hypothetical protein
MEFKLQPGRGDEFARGGGPDPRDTPRAAVQPRDIFIRDLHIDTLKVKSRNFHRQMLRQTMTVSKATMTSMNNATELPQNGRIQLTKGPHRRTRKQ